MTSPLDDLVAAIHGGRSRDDLCSALAAWGTAIAAEHLAGLTPDGEAVARALPVRVAS